jgi:hypothetical protein
MSKKTIKVELTVQEDDGRTVVRTLEGADAERWSKFITEVCVYAEARGASPDWASLGWKTEERGAAINE